MADRELRHMRRTELVEIIFALKQSEDQLKAENADLTAKLEQRQIHLYLSCPSVVGRPAAPVVTPAKFTEPTAISAARPSAAAFLNLLIKSSFCTLRAYRNNL